MKRPSAERTTVIDLGPGAGRHGGELIACGTAAEVSIQQCSLTGRYLAGDLTIQTPLIRRKPNGNFLIVKGAAQNNLKEYRRQVSLWG